MDGRERRALHGGAGQRGAAGPKPVAANKEIPGRTVGARQATRAFTVGLPAPPRRTQQPGRRTHRVHLRRALCPRPTRLHSARWYIIYMQFLPSFQALPPSSACAPSCLGRMYGSLGSLERGVRAESKGNEVQARGASKWQFKTRVQPGAWVKKSRRQGENKAFGVLLRGSDGTVRRQLVTCVAPSPTYDLRQRSLRCPLAFAHSHPFRPLIRPFLYLSSNQSTGFKIVLLLVPFVQHGVRCAC